MSVIDTFIVQNPILIICLPTTIFLTTMIIRATSKRIIKKYKTYKSNKRQDIDGIREA